MNENTEVTEDTNGWPGALLICKLSMKGDLSSALFTMSEVRNRKKFLRPHRRDSGKARTGAALGLMITINAACATLGTPIFGYIVDRTGSYTIAWQVLGAFLTLPTVQWDIVPEFTLFPFGPPVPSQTIPGCPGNIGPAYFALLSLVCQNRVAEPQGSSTSSF